MQYQNHVTNQEPNCGIRMSVTIIQEPLDFILKAFYWPPCNGSQHFGHCCVTCSSMSCKGTYNLLDFFKFPPCLKVLSYPLKSLFELWRHTSSLELLWLKRVVFLLALDVESYVQGH